MMAQSLRTCKIDLRLGNAQELKDSIEPIVPSLYDCLRIDVANAPPFHSMRCVPSPEIRDHFLKRLQTVNAVRKVRFAMFDAVHMFEPEYGMKEDLWWSPDELNEYRTLERQCSLDKAEQIYLKAYNEAFRELSVTKTISMPNKLKLVAGCALGFIGLQNVVSTEWRCTRRLDVRCIVASVIALQHRMLHSTNFAAMDIASIIASHSERLTHSHRMWSAVIGEAQKVAVEIS
jgi:hypothetical protein